MTHVLDVNMIYVVAASLTLVAIAVGISM